MPPLHFQTIGSVPEPFDAKPLMHKPFGMPWKIITISWGNFATEHKKVSSALTHFLIGTAAGEWAQDVKSLP